MAAWTLRGLLLTNKSLVEYGVTVGDSIWESATGISVGGRIARNFWSQTTPLECLTKNLPEIFEPVDHWSKLATKFSSGAVSLIAWTNELEFSIDIRLAFAKDVYELCCFALKSETSFILGADAIVHDADAPKFLQFVKESTAMAWARKFGKSHEDLK